MSSALSRPTISRDIQELIPGLMSHTGQAGITPDYSAPIASPSELESGAPFNFGNMRASSPSFSQDAPQVTSRTATAKGAPPLLAFLADFATSFGSGPQAAQNQQMMRSRGIEDFFTREQESADMRSGQVQQGFNLRQREIQNDENNALKLIIEGLRADTRKDVAATTQAGQKARTEIQEEGRNTRTSATLKSREQIAADNRTAAKERVNLMIAAARNRQASSLAHSSLMQNERLSQQERLNLGAKIAPLRAMEGQFADVLAAFEAAEDEVSPSGSAFGNIQLKTGGLLGTPSKNFSGLSTQLAQLKNELLKIRSGAAVVDQEFRRIANELPTLGGGENARWLGDNAEQFRQKLELGMADVQRNISIWGQVAGNVPQKPQGEQKKVTINWNDLPK